MKGSIGEDKVLQKRLQKKEDQIQKFEETLANQLKLFEIETIVSKAAYQDIVMKEEELQEQLEDFEIKFWCKYQNLHFKTDWFVVTIFNDAGITQAWRKKFTLFWNAYVFFLIKANFEQK